MPRKEAKLKGDNQTLTIHTTRIMMAAKRYLLGSRSVDTPTGTFVEDVLMMVVAAPRMPSFEYIGLVGCVQGR